MFLPQEFEQLEEIALLILASLALSYLNINFFNFELTPKKSRTCGTQTPATLSISKVLQLARRREVTGGPWDRRVSMRDRKWCELLDETENSVITRCESWHLEDQVTVNLAQPNAFNSFADWVLYLMDMVSEAEDDVLVHN